MPPQCNTVAEIEFKHTEKHARQYVKDIMQCQKEFYEKLYTEHKAYNIYVTEDANRYFLDNDNNYTRQTCTRCTTHTRRNSQKKPWLRCPAN